MGPEHVALVDLVVKYGPLGMSAALVWILYKVIQHGNEREAAREERLSRVLDESNSYARKQAEEIGRLTASCVEAIARSTEVIAQNTSAMSSNTRFMENLVQRQEGSSSRFPSVEKKGENHANRNARD